MPSKLLDRIDITTQDYLFGNKRSHFLYCLSNDYRANFEWVEEQAKSLPLTDIEERHWVGFKLRIERHINHLLALAETFYEELADIEIAIRLLEIVELGRDQGFDLKMSKRVAQSVLLAKVTRIKS